MTVLPQKTQPSRVNKTTRTVHTRTYTHALSHHKTITFACALQKGLKNQCILNLTSGPLTHKRFYIRVVSFQISELHARLCSKVTIFIT